MSHFDTFIAAVSRVADHRGILGEEYIEFPPSVAYDYWATPTNAVVFGCMGVDGVHYAILKIGGEIRDDSPVIQVAPMDFDEPYSLLAPNFLAYLATGCGQPTQAVQEFLKRQSTGEDVLLDYLRSHFDHSRFWTEGIDRNIEPFRSHIQTKDEGER